MTLQRRGIMGLLSARRLLGMAKVLWWKFSGEGPADFVFPELNVSSLTSIDLSRVGQLNLLYFDTTRHPPQNVTSGQSFRETEARRVLSERQRDCASERSGTCDVNRFAYGFSANHIPRRTLADAVCLSNVYPCLRSE